MVILTICFVHRQGVNTNAKNVVIINNSVGNTTMTAFALKNIKGRAGRYYHHAMGRVFYTDSKQRQIENADDMQLNFQTYDTHPILNEKRNLIGTYCQTTYL